MTNIGSKAIAKRNGTKSSPPASFVETDADLPPVAEYLRRELEEQFSCRESLRKTLLNTLRVSAQDLEEAITYGSVREAQAFAQLADDGPTYAAVLRRIAELIEFASERINGAVMLRSDAIELMEHSKKQHRKGSSSLKTTVPR